ncbi:hypothetical protein ACOSOMT5_P0225 [Acidiphilium sp. MT5]
MPVIFRCPFGDARKRRLWLMHRFYSLVAAMIAVLSIAGSNTASAAQPDTITPILKSFWHRYFVGKKRLLVMGTSAMHPYSFSGACVDQRGVTMIGAKHRVAIFSRPQFLSPFSNTEPLYPQLMRAIRHANGASYHTMGLPVGLILVRVTFTPLHNPLTDFFYSPNFYGPNGSWHHHRYWAIQLNAWDNNKHAFDTKHEFVLGKFHNHTFIVRIYQYYDMTPHQFSEIRSAKTKLNTFDRFQHPSLLHDSHAGNLFVVNSLFGIESNVGRRRCAAKVSTNTVRTH